MIKLIRLPLAVLVLTLANCAPRISAQQDSGASLVIRFADGNARFHVGEIIPIELSFSASVTDTYDIEMRNYDRSGRLEVDQFHVSPQGRDPLHDYYSSGAFIGGGLGGQNILSSTPQVFPEDVNEQVALDRPGHYSLYVISHRVFRRVGEKNESAELRSNTLDFEIVAADPAWQQQIFASTMATLENSSSTAEQKAAAVKTLRYLDMPESIQELIHLLGTYSMAGHFNEVAGLAGARDQSFVVRELERQLNAPDAALTQEFLYVLAKLKFQQDHPPLPLYPEKDVEQQKAWRERSVAQDTALRQERDALLVRVAGLVPMKSGMARTETVKTLLVLRSSMEQDDVKLLAGLPPEEVASAFLNLSPGEQSDVLSGAWDRLKDPAMYAPLKKLAEQSDLKHEWLRDQVLGRLYDLDPAGARPIFLQEISHPHLDNQVHSVRGFTLGVLPDELLPQFDETLAARLTRKEDLTLGLDARLVERYATKAILPEMKSVYGVYVNRSNCGLEDALVSYFLRVDPDYGISHLAMTPNACMKDSFSAAIKMRRWNEIEPSVIALLNDPNLYRAREAAETLSKYGSAESEKAVWERLRSFHAQWAEHADELTFRPGRQQDRYEAASFQFGLVEAFAAAQSWFLSNEKITALENLVLGQERDNVVRWHWSSPVGMSLYFTDGHIDARIGQYNTTDVALLQAKLAQYPAGTKFSLYANGPTDRLAPALAAINETATAHALQVEFERPGH